MSRFALAGQRSSGYGPAASELLVRSPADLPRDGGVQAVQGVHMGDEAEADLDGADGEEGDLPATDEDPMLRAAIDSGLVPPDAPVTDEGRE